MKDENKAKIEEKQLVIFKLAGEEFGVDISEVKEIIKMEDITTIPNIEDTIKGVINLRGRIIVVMNLAKKLNLGAKQDDKDTRIMIIEIGENIVGMVVESVEEVLRVTSDKISPSPELINRDINTSYIRGVCVLGQRLIILLDPAKIISAKEMDKIVKIQEQGSQ